MPEQFHNPYHFVPVSQDLGPGSTALPPGRHPSDLPEHVTHDRFLAGDPAGKQTNHFSGRIVVRLTIEEWSGVGGKQTPGNPASPRQVQLFRQGDVCAIPGSSLRGLLSSIAEAASNSTLRVLNEEPVLVYTNPRDRHSKRPKGTVHGFFRAVSPELVPLEPDDSRQTLTIAEQMFGLVEQVPEGQRAPANREVLAFAGRIRVSNAIHQGANPASREGRLKILDSPKAANSNFYFRPASGDGFVSKAALSPTQHWPHGRKFYLHRAPLKDGDWETHRDLYKVRVEQKADVVLLTEGEFWLAIDFENLIRPELELLAYSIRPAQKYHHKLGFGKPLGLGKIRLDPAGIFLVNRQACYSVDPLANPRYAALWRSPDIREWPARFEREWQAVAPQPCPAVGEWGQAWSKRVAAETPALSDTLRAFELLGDPARAPASLPVHYPQPLQRKGKEIGSGSPEMEDKGYEWFQNNQDAAGQYLRCLDAHNTSDFTRLPGLDREARTEPPGPPGSGPGAGPNSNPPGSDPASLRGQVLEFVLAGRRPNGNPVFRITLSGHEYEGHVSTNDALKLKLVPIGEQLKLKVLNFNADKFQLALPSAG